MNSWHANLLRCILESRVELSLSNKCVSTECWTSTCGPKMGISFFFVRKGKKGLATERSKCYTFYDLWSDSKENQYRCQIKCKTVVSVRRLH